MITFKTEVVQMFFLFGSQIERHLSLTTSGIGGGMITTKRTRCDVPDWLACLTGTCQMDMSGGPVPQ